MYIIYIHHIPDNKVYIGCTTASIEHRIKLGYSNTEFQRIVDKYGWSEIKSEILAQTDNKEEAKKLEQYYIELYNALNPEFGYNRKGSGYSMTVARRIKMSESTKEYWKNPEHLQKMKDAIAESRKSPEYRKKVSDAIKAKWNNPTYRDKVSESMKAKLQDMNYREQISKSLKTYWSDDARRAQHSETMKEAMNRPEVRAKISESRKHVDLNSEAMRRGRKVTAEKNRGRVGVHKEISGKNVNLRVAPDQVNNYIADGWIKGWITKGPGLQISKVIDGVLIKKRAKEDELSRYLADGWQKGWCVK